MRRPILSFALLLAVVVNADNPLHVKIHGVNVAHAKANQDQRLQHLADLAVATGASVSGSASPSASESAPPSSALAESQSASAGSSASASSSAASSTASNDVSTNSITPDADVSFQIYTTDLLPSPAPPSACATALTASVACNDTIQLLGGDPFFDTSDLAVICTPTCTKSLASYRAAVVSACGSYMLPGPNDVSYAPTLALDTIALPYAVQCRQDTTTTPPTFCTTILSSFGAPPSPAQGILSYPKNELCTPCMLGTLNATLSNPLYASTDYSDWFNVLKSAVATCGSQFNSYLVPPPSASATQPFTPGPSTTPIGSNDTTSALCALTGRNVTWTGNGGCVDVAKQFGVGYYDILSNNPTLQGTNCTSAADGGSGIGAGTSLCLPQSCTTYTPTTNQTCEDIVSAANKVLQGQTITVQQLVSFNSILDTGCLHVARTWGFSVCISPHGGFPDVSAIDNGAPGPVPTPTAIVPPPGQTPPGTTSNCGAWYLVSPGDICTKVALNNSITFPDLVTLNPELNDDCTNLWAKYWYCVAAYPPLNSGPSTTIPVGTGFFSMATIALPTPTSDPPYAYPTGHLAPPSNLASGSITTGCDNYYTVASGDTCDSIETLYNITADDFNFWNFDPQIPCPKLTAGSAICVLVVNVTAALPPTPTNAAAGSAPSGCARWYTIVNGDGCTSVEQKFALTQSQLFALNPELAPDCRNLALDEAYCVRAVPGAAPPSGPPSDLEPGSWSNCTSYCTVQSGDNCNLIEAKSNISFTDFLTWNPEVSTSCNNLALASYCVGIGGGCEGIYTVVSGDLCSTIESKTGVSDAQLRALNPWIDSGCNLQIGQNICIKNSHVTVPTGPPANLNPGSWSNCTTYYNVQSGDNCNLIESKFGIAFSDILKWNPEVSTTCGNLNLASYCVGIAGGCESTYTVISGDSCGAIESKTGLTDAVLKSLNPWIDANCNIQIGQAICTKNSHVTPPPSGPPADLNPGSWSNCSTYYNVQSGDNCNLIESKFHIGFSDILRWNPEVSTTCSNLNLASYCVLGSGACSKLYTVVSGDSCGAIESKQSITDAKIHAENTWINSACSNIQIGQNICV
ncbi:hypothetical protein R3P38DRAFT_2696023 [Favolaschia claudopus]|uniref:LysM domain-containing protein n=1 Tax=Favolaschia claudopus TaxID=2862362 RepID=A0AAW0CM64_9AGAR